MNRPTPKCRTRLLLALVLAGLGAGPAAGSPYNAVTPYTPVTRDEVTSVLLRVGRHLNLASPVPGATTTAPATRPTTRVSGQFSPVSYPMGVAYAGMLSAGDATGDPLFAAFVAARFQYLADQFHKLPADRDTHKRPMVPIGSLAVPRALDDCGAIAAAMVKGRRAHVGPDMSPLIDIAVSYVEHGEHRLGDGTIGRMRPFTDSLWADDMYMAVPLLSQAGTTDPTLLDDAAKQVLQLGDRLFVPSMGLFTHGWNARTADQQPRYHWGRANGWCAMAMAELLDVLPENHPKRPAILALFRQHARGIASCQGGTGLWHQMLDRPDSYAETSASAMFVFALAKGVNRGWLDASAYGPVALTGWNAITAEVDAEGKIHGTCIGTSYADDYVYYYRRPVGEDDPHGYGPVLLAGAEVIRLVNNPDLRVTGKGGLDPTMVRPATR